MDHDLPNGSPDHLLDRAAGDGQGTIDGGPSTGSQSRKPAGSAVEWDQIHDAIQEVFETLAARILTQEPRASSKAGRNSTRTFALFSYRVFPHLDGDDHDPVVVGISLNPRGDRVQIMGDISGDESGYVYFDQGCAIETNCEPQAIIEGARATAERLAAQESAIIEAIRNRHPCAVVK
jgi:hypothetical protein